MEEKYRVFNNGPHDPQTDESGPGGDPTVIATGNPG